MIGKPEWFARRKYGGWGLFPKTWQGWLYIIIAATPFFVFQFVGWGNKARMTATIVWGIVITVDFFDIMIRLKKDERENIHEAIAERNALWAIIIVLVIGVAYQAAVSAAKQKIEVDPFIIAAVVVGVAVKAITNIYLDRKD